MITLDYYYALIDRWMYPCYLIAMTNLTTYNNFTQTTPIIKKNAKFSLDPEKSPRPIKSPRH